MTDSKKSDPVRSAHPPVKPVTSNPLAPLQQGLEAGKARRAAEAERKAKLYTRDAQQHCRNGHSINWWFHDHPDGNRPFCPQCGAATLHACETCGIEVAGGLRLDRNAWDSRLSPAPPKRPDFCGQCGAAFPWTKPAQPLQPTIEPVAVLERQANKLPLIAHHLEQHYHKGRSGFRINDEYDAEHLLNALLFQHFEDVRREEPTPSYAGVLARTLVRDPRPDSSRSIPTVNAVGRRWIARRRCAVGV